MKKEINNCDGCQRGIPKTIGGRHNVERNGILIESELCTEDRYTHLENCTPDNASKKCSKHGVVHKNGGYPSCTPQVSERKECNCGMGDSHSWKHQENCPQFANKVITCKEVF